MDIKETKVDSVAIYSLQGKLDATNADEFLDKMTAIAKNGQKRFVFDLGNLEYISSSGLRAFLAIGKSIRGDGFVRFYNIRDQVEEVFTISGFDSIFKVFNNRETALK